MNQENPQNTPPGAPVPPGNQAPQQSPQTGGEKATTEQMREALKDVFDPEIPINIVDLGLIYKLEEKDGSVDVQMTLTSPHCPVGDQLKARVTEVVTKQPGITGCNVSLTFDPPWSKEKLSFEGKLQASMLGIM